MSRDEEIAEDNRQMGNLCTRGFRPWNDHPGYTISYLNKLLAPHNLKVETLDYGNSLWFRIDPREKTDA